MVIVEFKRLMNRVIKMTKKNKVLHWSQFTFATNKVIQIEFIEKQHFDLITISCQIGQIKLKSKTK